VLLVSSRTGSALLTGDIEAAAEKELLAHGLAPVDVVIAPHHGSGTSSTSSFVAALHPDVAIFSAGYRNRWNLPQPQIVQRWQQAGARTHSTSEGGALEVSLPARHRPIVNEYRRTHRRYWSRG
jgi:competence protein ComEC